MVLIGITSQPSAEFMSPVLSLIAIIFVTLLLVHWLLHRRWPRAPRFFSGWGCLIFVALGVLLFSLALGPIGPGNGGYKNVMMQNCRTIALAMFQYANDHDGNYPDGAGSTEVFQKLLDGNYVSDPALFYVAMPGKTKPDMEGKLRPENVCYDVTAGVNASSPGGLPLVFVTGFRIDYKPDGSAISLVKPFPLYEQNGNADDWFRHDVPLEGLQVAYINNNAFFKQSRTASPPATPFVGADGFGIVTDIVPADFDVYGTAYRQLTPTGVLR